MDCKLHAWVLLVCWTNDIEHNLLQWHLVNGAPSVYWYLSYFGRGKRPKGEKEGERERIRKNEGKKEKMKKKWERKKKRKKKRKCKGNSRNPVKIQEN